MFSTPLAPFSLAPTLTNLLYFTFQLATTTYGVESQTVVEVFFLPEVTPVPGLPPHGVGVLNVRGTILPVLDLNLRLGQQSHPYHTGDRVIVLAAQGQRFGIIVQDVYGMEQLTPEQMPTPVLTPATDDEGPGLHPQCSDPLQTGLARRQQAQQDIIVLLDTAQMLVAPQQPQVLSLNPLHLEEGAHPDWSNVVADINIMSPESPDSTPAAPKSLDPNSLDPQTRRRSLTPFCPAATPAERQLFCDRAEQLAQTTSQDHLALKQQTALAIIALGAEWFGLPVELIREFTEIQHVTPIPACPPHVLGNTNVRGEVMTLVDMSSFLDLPPLVVGDRWPAVIVDIAGTTFGIVVAAVIDIYLYDPTQQQAMPLAVQGVARELMEGAIDYQGTMVSRLNLPHLLAQEGFVVNFSLR